ncbi:MAG: lysophospholipase [Flammeovirgaceae bacterium]
MGYQESKLTDDKGELFIREWLPETDAQKIICLIHGQSEHSGRYEHVASFFNEQEIGVMAMDLVGHGKSYGKRGHIQSIHDYLQNVHTLINEAQKRHNGIPRVVYGHSMGGNVVANYALSQLFDDELQGIILSSPWFKLASAPPVFKEILAGIMNRIYPAYTENNKLTGKELSRDPKVAPAYVNDPLVHGKISAGAYYACRAAGLHALAHAHQLPKPTLVLHGTADSIISHQASKDFAKKANGLVTHLEFEGGYHELHNDIEWEKVMATIHEWIQQL